MTEELVVKELRLLLPAGAPMDGEFQFESLQIIKLVAKIEKKFQIEFEDKYIFRGLFKNIETLASYVRYQQGCKESTGWELAIKRSLE